MPLSQCSSREPHQPSPPLAPSFFSSPEKHKRMPSPSVSQPPFSFLDSCMTRWGPVAMKTPLSSFSKERGRSRASAFPSLLGFTRVEPQRSIQLCPLCPLRPRDQGSLPTGTSGALLRSPKSSRQVCLNSQGSQVDSPHCICGYGGHRQRHLADLCLLNASRKHQSRGPHHSLPETGLWPTSQNFVMFPARIHSIAPEAPASFPPHGVDS